MNYQTKKCKYFDCDGTTMELIPRQDKHQFHYECTKCKRFNDYPKKETNKRTQSHKDLVKKYNGDQCEWCGVPKELLPAKQYLEAHHIIPYKHGGESSRDNILILCTECHRDVEHKRTYKRHWIEELKKLKNNKNEQDILFSA